MGALAQRARRAGVALRPDNLGTTRALMSFLSGPAATTSSAPAAEGLLRRCCRTSAGRRPACWTSSTSRPSSTSNRSVRSTRRLEQGAGRGVRRRRLLRLPISGMGTSLALVGAYVLAGELARPCRARRRVRGPTRRSCGPTSGQAQHLPPFVPRVASPRTTTGIRVLNALLAVAARPQVRRLGSKLFTPPADAIDLPEYSAAGTAPIPASRSVSLPR